MPRIPMRGAVTAAAAAAAVSTTGLLVGATDAAASRGEGPGAATTATNAHTAGRKPAARRAPGDFAFARQSAVDWRIGAGRGPAAVTSLKAWARGVPGRASRGSSRAPLTGNPKAIARGLAATHGWGGGQVTCLESLWQKESGWNPRSANGSTGAYGIPQALPGSKMATHGADWRTNPATQIRWGLDYIDNRYGTPCDAWSFSRARNYY